MAFVEHIKWLRPQVLRHSCLCEAPMWCSVWIQRQRLFGQFKEHRLWQPSFRKNYGVETKSNSEVGTGTNVPTWARHVVTGVASVWQWREGSLEDEVLMLLTAFRDVLIPRSRSALCQFQPCRPCLSHLGSLLAQWSEGCKARLLQNHGSSRSCLLLPPAGISPPDTRGTGRLYQPKWLLRAGRQQGLSEGAWHICQNLGTGWYYDLFPFSFQHRCCSRWHNGTSQLALAKLFIIVKQYQIWSLDEDIGISTEHLVVLNIRKDDLRVPVGGYSTTLVQTL